MYKAAFIDSRFFSREDAGWKDEVISTCRESEITLSFDQVREKGTFHETDLITFINTGCAAAAVVIGIVNVLKKPKKQWTYNLLLEEIMAFARLKNIENFVVEKVEGFDNLIQNNAKPCVVTICHNEEKLHLYVGLTEQLLVVSSAEYDHRHF